MFERNFRRLAFPAAGSIFPQRKVSFFREIPVMHRLIHIIHRFSAEKVCSNPFSGRKSDFCSHLINFAISTKFLRHTQMIRRPGNALPVFLCIKPAPLLTLTDMLKYSSFLSCFLIMPELRVRKTRCNPCIASGKIPFGPNIF